MNAIVFQIQEVRWTQNFTILILDAYDYKEPFKKEDQESADILYM